MNDIKELKKIRTKGIFPRKEGETREEYRERFHKEFDNKYTRKKDESSLDGCGKLDKKRVNAPYWTKIDLPIPQEKRDFQTKRLGEDLEWINNELHSIDPSTRCLKTPANIARFSKTDPSVVQIYTDFILELKKESFFIGDKIPDYKREELYEDLLYLDEQLNQNMSVARIGRETGKNSNFINRQRAFLAELKKRDFFV